jgi:hypothetical protein
MFAKPFIVDYYFEEQQQLRFYVVDIDDESKGLDAQDFLGEATITLGNLGAFIRYIISC